MRAHCGTMFEFQFEQENKYLHGNEGKIIIVILDDAHLTHTEGKFTSTNLIIKSTEKGFLCYTDTVKLPGLSRREITLLFIPSNPHHPVLLPVHVTYFTIYETIAHLNKMCILPFYTK